MNHPGPRVLVVDDDRAIRRFLKVTLRANGYMVFEAGGARAALAAVEAVRPDVIILDLGLPDESGVEVARRLRVREQIPILVLSVKDQELDKVAALEAGADDYLTKPFGVGELHARLGVLLRRVAGARSGIPFRTGDLQVDLTRRLVKVGGSPVQLTPTEYDLLKALIHAAGRVLTHDQLMRQVWGPEYTIDHHLLRVNISTLRQKLGEDPTRRAYILTEPRIGYRLRVDEQG
jgi:two-component system, OmpR family, KDP operon response regulator KdpE